MGCCSQGNRPSEADSFGSYRKIPDKTKNTTWCEYQEFSYATSEMCGIL